MIDTIVITLEWRKDFEIKPEYYGYFSPNVGNYFHPPYVQFGKIKAVKAVTKVTAQEKKDGIYIPRLTMIKGVRKGSVPVTLNVEFSAPKVVNGDNYNELVDSDLDFLAEQLKRKLTRYGIIVTSNDTIKNAMVSTIHYSKNIPLTDYDTAYEVISDLEKCNFTTNKKADRQVYRGGGEAIHYYSSKWALCIYDKQKEYDQSKVSEKGLLEKDNYCQLSLFDDNPLARSVQMLRVEARYIGRQQIGKSLKDAGVTVNSYTLRDLFSEKVSKSMLKHEITRLRASYPVILLAKKSSRDLFIELQIQNPRKQLSTIMNAVAYKNLLNETGSRDLRTISTTTCQQWYRFNKTMATLNFDRRKLRSFDIVDEQLEKFVPVKLRKYLDK